MPKRVIDFDAMWASDKLSRCAAWAQAEYAWLYGLADANGSFELTNLRVIWGRVAAIRKELSLERLEQIFREFHNLGLLFIWEQNGKKYGHWTASDRPGRLPRPSWRERLERFAPPVPSKRLLDYMNAFSSTDLTPRRERTHAQYLDGDWDGDGEKKALQERPVGPLAVNARGEPECSDGSVGTHTTRLEDSFGTQKRCLADPCGTQQPHVAYQGVRLSISARQDSLLSEAFPWVERQAEYRKMDSWLEANPLRRPKNPSRFAHNWFNKIPAPGGNGSGNGRSDALPEARVGLGPSGRVKPEYLEKIRQQDAARMKTPNGGTRSQARP